MEVVTCPNCKFVGTPEDFERSDVDECWCPKCRCDFMTVEEDEDDEFEE